MSEGRNEPMRDEWVEEIRHLQAMLDEAIGPGGDLSCEDICRLVCAGPCVGAPFGPRRTRADQ